MSEIDSKLLEAEKELENNPKFYTSEEVLESMLISIEEWTNSSFSYFKLML